MNKNGLYVIIAILVLALPANAVDDEATVGYKDLRITYLNQDPDPVEPGNTIDVRFSLENVGATAVKNLKVELLPEYPLSLENTEVAVRDVGTVDPYIQGERALVQRWRLRADSAAAEGEYELKLRYTTNNGQSYTTKEDIMIHVEVVQKILSVESVEVTPNSVRPGQPASVQFDLKNLAGTLVQNVKVTLDLTDAPFGVLDSSTQKIIERIPSKTIGNVAFTLVPNSDAELKVYNIPFTMEYMDTSGNEYEVESSFGIRVDSEPEFVLNVEENNAVVAGSTDTMVISISNTGPSDIKFVELSVEPGEGYEIIGPSLKYLGNLESDDFETETFTIRVAPETETLSLNIKAKFKDSYNRAYDRTETLTTPIYSKSEARSLGLIPSARINPLFIVLGLAVIVGGFIWWRKRRKARR